MLLLLFRIGETWYGLDARQVQQVVPHVPLTTCPGMPASVAGIFTYRGSLVPVLDLGLLLGTTPCARRLSTRIIVVPWRKDRGIRRSLGLLAESVTGMTQVREDEATPGQSCLADSASPDVLAVPHRPMVRCLRVEGLLTPEAEQQLFAQVGRG